jgi:hypothetical protein
MTNYDIIKALGFKEVKDGIYTAYEYRYGSGIYTIAIQQVNPSYSRTERPCIKINSVDYHILDRATMTYLKIDQLLSHVYQSGVDSGMCTMIEIHLKAMHKIEEELRPKI